MQKNCSLSNQGRRSVGDHIPISDRNLELNSLISIPHCLELKRGDIYHINSNNGMRVGEDPRTLVSNNNADEFSGESDVTVFSEEDESEESSSESCGENHKEEVLVVAGCKACFMYSMVPKLFKDCPKCSSQLLHFHSA